MANFRYIVLIVLVVLAAVLAVLWQADEQPTITFTRSAQTDEPSTPGRLTNGEALPDGVLRADPFTDPLTPSDDGATLSPKLSPNNLREIPPEDQLSEEQLAEQIKLAQLKLAQVEALNARKQAHVNKILAQESSVEQPLIEAELAYRIGGWRQAWRTGDVHDYFNYYSDKFRPSNGKSFEEWKAQRVKRLNPGQPIDLDLENFEVTFDPATQRSLVTFSQFYKSGDYQDTSKKRLIMVNELGQWKIVSESTQ